MYIDTRGFNIKEFHKITSNLSVVDSNIALPIINILPGEILSNY